MKRTFSLLLMFGLCQTQLSQQSGTDYSIVIGNNYEPGEQDRRAAAQFTNSITGGVSINEMLYYAERFRRRCLVGYAGA